MRTGRSTAAGSHRREDAVGPQTEYTKALRAAHAAIGPRSDEVAPRSAQSTERALARMACGSGCAWGALTKGRLRRGTQLGLVRQRDPTRCRRAPDAQGTCESAMNCPAPFNLDGDSAEAGPDLPIWPTDTVLRHELEKLGCAREGVPRRLLAVFTPPQHRPARRVLKGTCIYAARSYGIVYRYEQSARPAAAHTLARNDHE